MMMKPLLSNEPHLLQQLKEGDEMAFSAIYNHYKGPLILQAKRTLHDIADAEDIVQELMVSLWEKRSDLVIRTDLSTYLYGALRNRILNWIAHREVRERYITDFAAFLERGEYTTDRDVRMHELNRLVEEAIEAMPEKMKQVFLLSRQTDLTNKEIAGKLAIEESTVKTHIHRAIKILRKKFRVLFYLFFNFF